MLLPFTVAVQAPVLVVDQTQILLGGDDGLSTAPQTLSFTLGSGSANHSYTLTFSPDSGGDWLDASAPTGNVGSAGASVQISALRGSLTGATYTGQLTLKATVRDLELTEVLPVTYNLEANRIVVGAAGVGLSSAPVRSVLSRDVTVFSSIGRTDVPWHAVSDQSWLSATASGDTGGAITLTANPAGLAAGATYFATVTVTSSDPTVENQETIRVGLRVNNVAAADLSNTMTAQFIAASPVEPLVFINDGGADVFAYDVYTGVLQRTFSGVVANAGAMAVAADGQRLYVYDRTNLRVTELNAVTGAVMRQFGSLLTGGTPAGGGLAFFRPDGYSVLVTPSARIYDVNTGVEYQNAQFNAPAYALSLGSSSDGRFLVDDNGSVYRMRRTALNGGAITAQFEFNPGTAQGRAGQACISEDLQFVYTASGAPYNFPGSSLQTHAIARVLPGTNYPNSILCLWNGIVIGGVDGYYSADDVWIYDGPSGQEFARRSSSIAVYGRSLVDRGMAASADATRLITLTESSPGINRAQEVRFQSLPDPP